MPHDVSLITTIAAALGLALVLGFSPRWSACRRWSATWSPASSSARPRRASSPTSSLASQLAEIGVMLLMFGVGLHFSLDDLLAVRRIALPGAVVQIVVATALGRRRWRTAWGWSFGRRARVRPALSVASTVVLLRALEAAACWSRSTAASPSAGWWSRTWSMVLVLVLLPPLAGVLGGDAGRGHGAAGRGEHLDCTLAVTLGKVAAFVALMLVVGPRAVPWLLWQVARTGSRELFTLCVVAAAVGIAYGSAELFGVSFALGAFFAGMVLRESELSHRAAEESLPLRDAFSVLFFVSVGMLFDPRSLVARAAAGAGVVAIIMVGKTLAAFVAGARLPLPAQHRADGVGASLAQIGEFSFILAGLGVASGLLPAEGQSLILAGALISIALNPLVFAAIEPVQRWIRRALRAGRALERRDDPLAELPTTVDAEALTGHVVLVGYGRVGRRIAEALQRERDSPSWSPSRTASWWSDCATRDSRRVGRRVASRRC